MEGRAPTAKPAYQADDGKDAQVNEQDIGRIRAGARGRARLITGEELTGEVAFVASMADQQTRTFRLELNVGNPDGALPDGVSAELRLPAGDARAHWVSPAVLTLSGDGLVGVKLVDRDNRVRFKPGLGEIQLYGSHILVNKALRVTDPEGDVVVNGRGTNRIFYIYASGVPRDIAIDGITFTNAGSLATGYGGAIYCNESSSPEIRSERDTFGRLRGERRWSKQRFMAIRYSQVLTRAPCLKVSARVYALR